MKKIKCDTILVCLLVVSLTIMVSFTISNFAIIKNSKKMEKVTTDYIDISEKWYDYIVYYGYIDYFGSYEYGVFWTEETETECVEKHRIISLDIPPSSAVLYFEQHENDIKKEGVRD